MNAANTDQDLQIALQHHRAGRLAQAEPLYRAILVQQPTNAEAMQLLGVLAAQCNRRDIAIELIAKAISLNPNSAEYYNNYGIVLSDLGRLDQAITAFRRAITLRPTFAEAHSNLGVRLFENGQVIEAMESYRRSIALNPNMPESHNNLGNTLRIAGDSQQAIESFHRAIQLRPNYHEAHSNLGIALKDVGRLDEAIASFRHAIALRPDYAQAYNNLGSLLKDLKRYDEVIALFQHALQLDPNYAEVHYNLGNAYKDQGQFDQAIACYQKALSLRPTMAEGHSNLGFVYSKQERLADALQSFERAIELKPTLPEAHFNRGNTLRDLNRVPEAADSYRQAFTVQSDYVDAHWNYALSLLQIGEFEKGWEEYEWRWRRAEYVGKKRTYPQPQWDGSDLAGKTIFIHCEQGFGDSLQFVRYLPLIQSRGAKIVLECPEPLRRLFNGISPVEQVITSGEPLPAFDFHVPLMSLPLLFETTVANIPHDVPYLWPEPELIQKWSDRIDANDSKIKIGLAWGGNPQNETDRHRSIPLELVAPLARMEGVSFYSLQKGPHSAEARHPSLAITLIDHTSDLHDFADTAALIMNLDLVITVETGVAHLAGALAKPVWTLLHHVPDWRWMLDRNDSPWYPTMRLFRQPKPGDWPAVVGKVIAELKQFQRTDP